MDQLEQVTSIYLGSEFIIINIIDLFKLNMHVVNDKTWENELILLLSNHLEDRFSTSRVPSTSDAAGEVVWTC